MKKRSSLYNLLFAVGLLLIIGGIFLTLQLADSISVTSRNAAFVILWFVLGGYFLFHEFTQNKSSLGLFIGFYSLVIGVVVMLSGSGTRFVSFHQLWPVLVIGFGICFSVAGIISSRKRLAFYIIPSSILILLGLVFLLFSFDIITVRFSEFAARWWPVLLIFCGICLVALFYQRKHFSRNAAYLFEDEDDPADYDDYLSY